MTLFLDYFCSFCSLEVVDCEGVRGKNRGVLCYYPPPQNPFPTTPQPHPTMQNGYRLLTALDTYILVLFLTITVIFFVLGSVDFQGVMIKVYVFILFLLAILKLVLTFVLAATANDTVLITFFDIVTTNTHVNLKRIPFNGCVVAEIHSLKNLTDRLTIQCERYTQ